MDISRLLFQRNAGNRQKAPGKVNAWSDVPGLRHVSQKAQGKTNACGNMPESRHESQKAKAKEFASGDAPNPGHCTLKAQASLEQLVVIGTALAFISMAFFLAATMSSENIKIAQAQDSVERLAASVDYVYSLGTNTKEYVTVFLPAEIISTNTTGRVIALKVGTAAGATDIYAGTRAEVIGTIDAKPGRQKILVEYLPTGKVRIGTAGLECAPSYIVKQVSSGATGTASMTFTNNADFNITPVVANYTGVSFATLGYVPSKINAQASANTTLSYSIPSNTPSGLYSGVVSVESANGGACTVQVSFKVIGTSTCNAMCASNGYLRGTCRATSSLCIANGDDYVSGYNSSCTAQACCCGPTQDITGPIVTNISTTPSNVSTYDNVTIHTTCSDAGTGGSFIKKMEIQIDNGNWTSMNASPDSLFSDSIMHNGTAFVGTLSEGRHIVVARCTDTSNNTGPMAYYYFDVYLADIYGPIITQLNHTGTAATITVLAQIVALGTVTDYFTGNHSIASCVVRMDSFGNKTDDWISVPADDGAYDSSDETFAYDFGQVPAGKHTINARCTDSLGNVGGIFNNTFDIMAVDMMFIIDRSGSMAYTVPTSYTNTTIVSTTATEFTLAKNLSVKSNIGGLIDLAIRSKSSSSSCTTSYEARINSIVIASGTRTSTSYSTNPGPFNDINVSAYTAPYRIDIYYKTSAAGCTAYVSTVTATITPTPTKIDIAQNAAGTLIDILTNTSLAGLVSYNTTSTTDKILTNMSTADNKTALKNSINAISPVGGTYIKGGIDSAVTELISARSRNDSVKVAILLTDGVNDPASSNIDGAVYARNNNVTLYTIGFGSDVDPEELTNIALLTNGKYYFAPDAETLVYIYTHLGE